MAGRAIPSRVPTPAQAVEKLARLRATASARYPLLELALNHHRTERRTPLRFAKSKPFLSELYQTGHLGDGFDVMAATQCGKTVLLQVLAFERAGWAGRIVATVMPTAHGRDGYVQRRINPLLAEVPAYRQRLIGDPSPTRTGPEVASDTKPDNLRLKRFGEGTLMFLSAGVGNDFVEFSADLVIIDELDECLDQNDGATNLARARNRLRESPHGGQLVRVGNPTLSGYGIDRVYHQGDQRRYHWRCEHCRTWQALDWWTNIVERHEGTWRMRDPQRRHPVCRACAKPFRRQILQNGEVVAKWIPTVPSTRDAPRRRSYLISRLDMLDESLSDLLQEYLAGLGDPNAEQNFVNNVLGMGFKGAGRRVTAELLEGLTRGPEMVACWHDRLGECQVVAGIDVGRVFHLDLGVIEEIPQEPDADGYPQPPRREVRSLFVGELASEDAVMQVLREYRCKVAVIDRGPELHTAQRIRDTLSADGVAVWLCSFASGPKVGAGDFGMTLKADGRHVTVDRTGAFDAAFADMTRGARSWPVDARAVPGWLDQMQVPVRKLDAKRDTYVWTKTDEPDHYRLADVYLRVAVEILARGGAYYAE